MTYPEVELAQAMGVPVGRFREARKEHLAEGEDWMMEGRRVVYTKKGREAVMPYIVPESVQAGRAGAEGGTTQGESVTTEIEAVTAAWEQKKGDVADAEVVWLRGAPCRNRRIVMARLDGEVIRVRVRDNKHFRPRMRIRCRLVSGNLFMIVGRGPRYPGRY